MEGLCKRSLFVFCVQMIVLVMVIATALLNLSLHKDHHKIWFYLLCTCLGVLFPNPKIKSKTKPHDFNSHAVYKSNHTNRIHNICLGYETPENHKYSNLK